MTALPFGQIEYHPYEMNKRGLKKVSLWEFFALVFAFSTIIGFVIVKPDSLHYDLGNYLKTANGDYGNYYYAYWFVPVFRLLGSLPVVSSFLLWDAIGVISVFFATRIFGGNPVVVLVSFQMCYTLYQGQITGLIVGALALLWWGMAQKRWLFAGVGLLIASTKFQSGFVIAIIMLLMADVSWKERLRVVFLPLVVFLFSLLQYPGWPLQLISVIKSNPPNDWGNLTLWQWVGPAILVLWIPPILLPLTKENRLIALVSTATLAVPYFQQSDLITLFAFPIGWIPIAGSLGVLGVKFGYIVQHLLALIPLTVYFILITKPLLPLLHYRTENN